MPKPSKEEKNVKNPHVKTAKNGILYVVGQIVGSFSILILLSLLARLLKPSNFGLYAIVIAFYTLLGIIGNFGIGTALRKKLAETENKTKRSELISNSYFMAMAIALVIAIAGVVLSGSIAAYIYHEPSLATALQLASVLVIFWVFFNLTIAVLVGLEKVKEATIIDLFYSVVQPIAAVGLVVLGYGIFGAVTGIAISIVLGSVLGLFFLSKEIDNRIIKPTKKMIKELMEFSIPIATSNIALLGPPNFAILLLGVYATSAIVGNYNAAYELGNFVGIIFSSSTFVLLPVFASMFAKNDTKSKISSMYNGSIYYTLLFLLPVLAYVVGVAQPLMYLFFSKVYSMTPFYFSFIALGSTIGIIGAYAGTLIVGYGDTKRFMIYQVLIVIVELVLLFLLTPIFKGIGVLLALFLVGPIILDIIYIRALHRQFAFKQEFGKIVPLLIAAIITFAILYGVTFLLNQSKWALPVDLVLTILIYVPLAAIFKGITSKELEFLESISDSYKLDFIAKYIFDYAKFFIRKDSSK